LTHPAVVALALFLLFLGLLTSSKQVMAEPVAAYSLMALARYGWRHPVVWICIPLAIASYQYFVFPIANYARNAGALYKNPREAALATAEIVSGYLTDSSFREYVQQIASIVHNEKDAYLDEKLSPYLRFAMIGEADRLISTSGVYQQTEWSTIYTALLVQVPAFLYPRKPQQGAGNFLGRYAGDLDQNDRQTQVSYGFMANAHNAFGLPVVLPFSIIGVIFVLTMVASFTSGPVYTNPWSMYAIAAAHQEYVESPFSGLVGIVHEPIIAFIVLLTVIGANWLRIQISARLAHNVAHSPTHASSPETLDTYDSNVVEGQSSISRQ
jgi:hypothetical protein